jgi:ABC-type Zn2+ transport system substrate-binding protein/surface adhesin
VAQAHTQTRTHTYTHIHTHTQTHTHTHTHTHKHTHTNTHTYTHKHTHTQTHTHTYREFGKSKLNTFTKQHHVKCTNQFPTKLNGKMLISQSFNVFVLTFNALCCKTFNMWLSPFQYKPLYLVLNLPRLSKKSHFLQAWKDTSSDLAQSILPNPA